jgi:hypothetical protein
MIIPVSLAGVAESDISVVWELVTLKTPKGTFRPAGFTSAPGRQYLRFDLSRAVFDTWKDTPIRLTASYSVAIFSEVGSVDLFEKGQPVRSPVLGQCGIAEGTRFQWGRRILCRNAFETHGTQLSQVTEDAIVAQGWEGSSIDMRLDPIVEQVYPPYLVDSPRLQASKLRLTVREPRAIAQGTIEIPDLRLADYAASR